jgi:cytochrome c556
MRIRILVCAGLLLSSSLGWAEADQRQWVKLPEMMQAHMLANMRHHLETINLILLQLSAGELDKAADTAEQNLGMSSLDKHGAEHLAKFMPEQMRETGTRMHHAASRFALKAQEGDVLPAYAALHEITAACVACHAAYRIR